MCPGVRFHRGAFSIVARTHPKAPSKGAAERLMALESALERDVQNRGLGADQRGGCAIHTQSQGKVLGSLAKNCTECSMSVKRGLPCARKPSSTAVRSCRDFGSRT